MAPAAQLTVTSNEAQAGDPHYSIHGNHTHHCPTSMPLSVPPQTTLSNTLRYIIHNTHRLQTAV